MVDIQEIINKYSKQGNGLITILEEIQGKYGYLTETALRMVSQETGRSLVDIYGVATFYRSFSLKPRGRHLISVCVGTACHVRGAPVVLKEFERQLGIPAGITTQDKEFSLETVNCLGACALGPIVVVDGHYFSNVNKMKVKRIINKTIEGLDKIEIKTDKRIFPVEVSCSRCNHSLMDPDHIIDGYPSIRVVVSFGRQHGSLWLSCLYGSFNIDAAVEIPEEYVVDLFCPHCHSELAGAALCSECNAPMVRMIVRGGGMIKICTRKGCRSHMLDLDGLNF